MLRYCESISGANSVKLPYSFWKHKLIQIYSLSSTDVSPSGSK